MLQRAYFYVICLIIYYAVVIGDTHTILYNVNVTIFYLTM